MGGFFGSAAGRPGGDAPGGFSPAPRSLSFPSRPTPAAADDSCTTNRLRPAERETLRPAAFFSCAPTDFASYAGRAGDEDNTATWSRAGREQGWFPAGFVMRPASHLAFSHRGHPGYDAAVPHSTPRGRPAQAVIQRPALSFSCRALPLGPPHGECLGLVPNTLHVMITGYKGWGDRCQAPP